MGPAATGGIPRGPVLHRERLLGVPLQLCQIVERIGPVQLTSMDQAHERIADSSAVQRLIEECVFAVEDGFLQGALDDVIGRLGRPVA
jgi:hypothetical protein